MAALDVARMSEPVSADAPCGPDLDLEENPEYLQCVAFVEGLLPLAYLTRDEEGRPQIFDRTSIDIPAALKRLSDLLAETRDLRLLTLYGRLCALNRDLGGLSDTLTLCANLLQGAWAEVHPRGDGADYSFRSAVLQAFDDMPTVVLPVQYTPLCESRRYGPISFRTVMVAQGEVPAREGETAVDRGAIERTLGDADIDAVRTVADQFAAIERAAQAIREVCVAQAGYDQAVSLARLSALAGRALALLNPIIQARTGAVATPPDLGANAPAADVHAPAAALPGTGRVAGVRDASAALEVASAYLRRSEPSSPAEVLTRQAQMLVGKSFLEVMTILVPEHAGAAVIAIGAGGPLRLSFEQLDAVPRADTPDSGAESEGDAPADSAPEPPLFRAETRAEALALLTEVGQFYRRAEPSSPIPLLLDRASGLIERDFLSILKDVLPDLVASRAET
ncbi:ImpA family type VI secretion system protein [Methylobacterium sp. J-068]|uniref:type VI secretion system protein TssA n=1 Tax=Methylobacterium sp. J-068 TaxID=2836649 RepID=UPI001FB9F0A0|nr:type VI secretion system ImpA family N-terminal domain-containing protein [Methylobacterium sp. J-068]MCJ2033862.1 type VI secretion system ImpA family N-terminal domain-containing protein [Methylobacterium sp. J-068]